MPTLVDFMQQLLVVGMPIALAFVLAVCFGVVGLFALLALAVKCWRAVFRDCSGDQR